MHKKICKFVRSNKKCTYPIKKLNFAKNKLIQLNFQIFKRLYTCTRSPFIDSMQKNDEYTRLTIDKSYEAKYRQNALYIFKHILT